MFLSLVAVSQVNYGPLVEQTCDTNQSRDLYFDIDNKLVNFVQHLFSIENHDVATSFACDHKMDGGLELMLPGVYYANMKVL